MPNIPPETAEKRKPALSPIGDEKVASEVQTFFDEALKDRLPWEASWLEWLAFYQGEPYVKFNAEQNKMIPDTRLAPWRRRIKENRIRTTIDQMVAMLLAEPVMLAARPASGDFDDTNKAEIASAILRFFNEDLGFEDLDVIVRTWKSIIGHCGIEVEWDSSAGPFEATPALDEKGELGPLKDPETGQVIYKAKGRIRLNFLTPFEMLWGPTTGRGKNARYVIVLATMDSKDANRRWPGSAGSSGEGRTGTGGAAKGRLGSLLSRVRSIFGPKRGPGDSFGTQNAAGVDVLKIYWAPDEDNPGGRLIIKVGSKVVYDDVAPTEGVFESSVVTFYHREHGKRPYGDGVVQDLIDLQREWNKTKSWMSEYRDLMQKGKIFAPREAGIDRDAFTTEHGEVIEWDALGSNGVAPTIQYPQPMPSSIFQSLTQMQGDFNYVSGINDAARGDAPGGAGGSGKALAFQKEQNSQRLQVNIRQDRKAWAQVGSLCLFFAGKHWDDNTVIRTVGRYYEPMIVDFRKSDFGQKWDVVVENDNALPTERVNRLNMISQMFQPGGIMDPGTPMEKRRQFLSLARFGDLQGLIETENRDESKARRQFRLCLMGQAQQAAYFDDHATHRRILTDLMKSIEFEEAIPQTKEIVIELDRQHATYLTGTQPMDPQGRPLPPGTVPPTQLGEMGRALMSPPPRGSPPAARPVQA